MQNFDCAHMNRLSDFKPLRQVTLPGTGDIECSGLTLIVGPNSSGKTQLLQDLHFRLSGNPRNLVVAKDIELAKPQFDRLMECLHTEGYIELRRDGSGTPIQILPRTTYLGIGQTVPNFTYSEAKSWHHSYEPSRNNGQQNHFLTQIGQLLVSALFLDRRLTSLGTVGVIDFQNHTPTHDLHTLIINDDARTALEKEIFISFGKTIWPDMAQGNTVSLRVSDEQPTHQDRLSIKKMLKYRKIETEGDGLKSYVATCIAILLGRLPVCLIDEPEICLHPPQAYNLGMFIGRHDHATPQLL